jgi:nicotinamide mononucleotide (NMN) deamidase PncC
MLSDPLLASAHRAGALLRERGETVAVAEGSAGGLISAALLSLAIATLDLLVATLENSPIDGGP